MGNIDNKKKQGTLKIGLEAMNISYTTIGAPKKIGKHEFELLQHAENDKENGRIYSYTSHRDILGR